ncbi:hypothetical protein [Azohydromonas aeria]|uniref:hypothetical protein n=1 Tax=Azohydromonas aeria TaxID=2590212 RepID=UPI0012FB9CDE|nr:hypothetical protein [Azohydromonas aeria]
MSGLAMALVGIDALLLLLLPRRWAAVPILAAACYLPVGAGFDIGPINVYGIRIILMLALLRMLLRNEGLAGGMNRVDWLMLWWSLVAIASSLFYDDTMSVFVNRAGLVFMACGCYFPLRAFCTSRDDVMRLTRALALLLWPVALAMLHEKLDGTNVFAEFGGLSPYSEVRNGTIRAQGAFSHSILAGSVGASMLPLMAMLWRTHRATALAGIAAALGMVFMSGSTGPIMGSAFALAALLMWRGRQHMRLVRWGAVAAYVGLELVMNAPAYFIFAYIDLTGSSTSWHRAALIDAAVIHFPEWWLAGTSYTRHWMPYGVPWSSNHIDITNYYIRMGVYGGLPLMLMFIAVMAAAFSLAGKSLRALGGAGSGEAFLIWTLGASLFAHVTNFLSVSYFDQSIVFFYFTLAAIGSAAVQQAGSSIQVPATSGFEGPQYRFNT